MTWREQAACLGVPDYVFFDDAVNEFATARRICASCPVIAECQAMCDTYEGMRKANDLYGVFAGEDPRQRVNRRRRQKRRMSNHDRRHQLHPISDYIEDDAA